MNLTRAELEEASRRDPLLSFEYLHKNLQMWRTQENRDFFRDIAYSGRKETFMYMYMYDGAIKDLRERHSDWLENKQAAAALAASERAASPENELARATHSLAQLVQKRLDWVLVLVIVVLVALLLRK